MSAQHLQSSTTSPSSFSNSSSSFSSSSLSSTVFDRKTNFLTTSRTIRLFGAGVRAPSADAKIVYIGGIYFVYLKHHQYHVGYVVGPNTNYSLLFFSSLFLIILDLYFFSPPNLFSTIYINDMCVLMIKYICGDK